MKPYNTVTEGMDDYTRNVHRLFDRLFNESSKTVEEYAEYVTDAARSGLKAEPKKRYWAKGVDHAVNSGGELWQDTFQRERLFKEYGIWSQGAGDPDKLYARCMLKYLDEVGALSDSLYEREMAKAASR